MPSSRHNNKRSKRRRVADEPRDFAQLGLDFSTASEYSFLPRKEPITMNNELLEALENKVNGLLQKYSNLKDENKRLAEENQRLLSEREGLKSRVDSIIGKLEGI